MPSAERVASRRTQEERSEQTRRKLLDATIDCLIERGYAGTTTTVVSKQAGLSRGAQLHHFPTKSELVVAAIGHLAVRRRDEFAAELESLPGRGRRSDRLIDLLWKTLSGPSFDASMELWLAARTDAELRDRLRPLEREIRLMAGEGLAALLDEDDTSPRARLVADLTIDLLIGLALQRVVRPHGDLDRVVEDWKRTVRNDLLP